jgi:hypothetical protein
VLEEFSLQVQQLLILLLSGNMTEEDLKIGVLNTITLMLSFTTIEATLRVALLGVSIAYTGFKLYKLIKERKKWL